MGCLCAILCVSRGHWVIPFCSLHVQYTFVCMWACKCVQLHTFQNGSDSQNHRVQRKFLLNNRERNKFPFLKATHKKSQSVDAYKCLTCFFQDMKKDPKHHISQISSLLGLNLSDVVIDLIVQKTSFQNMKQNSLLDISGIYFLPLMLTASRTWDPGLRPPRNPHLRAGPWHWTSHPTFCSAVDEHWPQPYFLNLGWNSSSFPKMFLLQLPDLLHIPNLKHHGWGHMYGIAMQMNPATKTVYGQIYFNCIPSRSSACRFARWIRPQGSRQEGRHGWLEGLLQPGADTIHPEEDWRHRHASRVLIQGNGRSPFNLNIFLSFDVLTTWKGTATFSRKLDWTISNLKNVQLFCKNIYFTHMHGIEHIWYLNVWKHLDSCARAFQIGTP